MNPRHILLLNLPATVLLLSSGCQHPRLAFATATKFGLDISQRADQQPEITVGYQRAELVSMPLTNTNATATADAYSVAGIFEVKYGPLFGAGSNEAGVRIHQVFATGEAAKSAMASKNLGKFFGTEARTIDNKATVPAPKR